MRAGLTAFAACGAPRAIAVTEMTGSERLLHVAAAGSAKLKGKSKGKDEPRLNLNGKSKGKDEPSLDFTRLPSLENVHFDLLHVAELSKGKGKSTANPAQAPIAPAVVEKEKSPANPALAPIAPADVEKEARGQKQATRCQVGNFKLEAGPSSPVTCHVYRTSAADTAPDTATAADVAHNGLRKRSRAEAFHGHS